MLLILLSGCLFGFSFIGSGIKEAQRLFLCGEANHNEAHDLLPKMDVDEIVIDVPGFELVVSAADFVEADIRGQSKQLRGYILNMPVIKKGKTVIVKRIVVTGRMLNGKIYLNPAVLAHEIEHLINRTDPRFVNPDSKYKAVGY